MVKQSIDVIKGYLAWLTIQWKEQLDYPNLVLVLTGENEKVDDYALRYLDQIMDRRCAGQALVIVFDEEAAQKARLYQHRHAVRVKAISAQKMELIHKWHCLGRFYKNLIFTYVRTNKDNLLERFLNETEINEEDIVCLVFYNLRSVPIKSAGIHNV